MANHVVYILAAEGLEDSVWAMIRHFAHEGAWSKQLPIWELLLWLPDPYYSFQHFSINLKCHALLALLEDVVNYHQT